MWLQDTKTPLAVVMAVCAGIACHLLSPVIAQPPVAPGVTITLTAEQAQAVASQVGGGEGLEYARVMLPHVEREHAEAVAEFERLKATTATDQMWNDPKTGQPQTGGSITGGPAGSLTWEQVIEAYRRNPAIPPTNAYRRAIAIQAAQRLYEDAVFRLQRTRSAIERLGGTQQ